MSSKTGRNEKEKPQRDPGRAYLYSKPSLSPASSLQRPSSASTRRTHSRTGSQSSTGPGPAAYLPDDNGADGEGNLPIPTVIALSAGPLLCCIKSAGQEAAPCMHPSYRHKPGSHCFWQKDVKLTVCWPMLQVPRLQRRRRQRWHPCQRSGSAQARLPAPPQLQRSPMTSQSSATRSGQTGAQIPTPHSTHIPSISFSLCLQGHDVNIKC